MRPARSHRSSARRRRGASPRTSPAWSRKAARRSRPTCKPREEGQLKTGLSDEVDRHGQDPRRGRRILAVRSAAARSNCSRGSARPISTCGAPRSSGWPARTPTPVVAARPEGQALRRSGMVVEPVLRLPQAGLSARARNWADHLVKDAKGLDPHTRQKAEFYVQADRQRAVAVELRADQSGTAARDARLQRREPGARHAHAGRGHRGRRRRSEDPAVRRGEVRGRPQSRGHARQGDLPERADAAHPVRAVDARRC